MDCEIYGASVSDVPPEPICLICGVDIGTTDWLGMPKEFSRLPEDEQYWKEIWKPGPEHLMVSSFEAENIYLERFPQLWGCLYRAIIQESRTKYRLTGISSVKPRKGPYYAVNDPQKARMSGTKSPRYSSKPQMFTQFFPAHIKRQPDLYKGKTVGYMIHAHCWVMLGRTEGLALNNITTASSTKLSKIVRICWKYWGKNFMWGSSFTEIPGRYLDYQTRFLCRIDVTQSPLVVPAIKQAIESAEIYHYQLPIHSIFRIVPLELRITVAENICPITKCTASDIEDLRNMLFASGWE